MTPERQKRYHAKHRDAINARRRKAYKAKHPKAAPSKPKPSAPSKPHPADVVADFASRLTVPHGQGAGKPFALQPWQVDWLRMALAPGIREAGLSCPRKLGKSSTLAVVFLAHLFDEGLQGGPYWRGLVVSLNAKLAGELRDLVTQIAQVSGLDLRTVRAPHPGFVEGANGSRVDFLAADKSRSGAGHASAANIACIDEAGRIPPSHLGLWNAMLTSVSSRDGRLLAIGTQSFSPMFRSLQDRANDPAVAWRRYSAAPDCDLDDREQWAAANPGLGGVKPLAYLEDQCRRALQDPENEPDYRELELNQDATAHRDVIVTLGQWKKCVGQLPPRTGPVVIGLDVGDVDSMTCLCAYWPSSGRLESWAAVGGEPAIEARARRDHVDYPRMVAEGSLTVWPAVRVTPVAPFLEECAERLRGERIALVAADRFRYGEVMDALTALRLPWPVHEKLSWRGQGAGNAATGSRDIREFRNAVLGERLRERGSWLMESAIAESQLVYDDLGNPKLKRFRKRGKIDALSSAVVALGAAAAWKPPGPTRWLKVA